VQIEEYVKCSGLGDDDTKKCWSTMQLPGVEDVVRNPLVLSMFLSALPSMAPGQFGSLSRYSIYNSFAEQWFRREVERLPYVVRHPLGLETSGPDSRRSLELEAHFELLSALLAGVMLHNETSSLSFVEIDDAGDCAIPNALWARVKDLADEWIVEPATACAAGMLRGAKLRAVQAAILCPMTAVDNVSFACPLRRVDDSLEFIHKSLWEFFCARLVFLTAGMDAPMNTRVKRARVALSTPGRCITSEPEVLQFLAEQWRSLQPDAVAVRCRTYECFLEVVRASANKERSDAHGSPAANAVSILNWMGEPLLKQPWTGVQLVGADLSRAILCGSILKGANLTCCRLEGAVLRDVDLTGATLQSLNCGEPSPVWLGDGFRSYAVHCFASSVIAAVPTRGGVMLKRLDCVEKPDDFMPCPPVCNSTCVALGLVTLGSNVEVLLLAIGCYDGQIVLCELSGLSRTWHVVCGSSNVLAVPSGETAAPRTVPTLRRQDSLPSTAVKSLCLSPTVHGRTCLAGVVGVGSLCVWNMDVVLSDPIPEPTSWNQRILQPDPPNVSCVCFASSEADGVVLVVGLGRELWLYLIVGNIWKRFKTFRWSQIVTSIGAFNGNCLGLVVGGGRGAVDLWWLSEPCAAGHCKLAKQQKLLGCSNKVVGVAVRSSPAGRGQQHFVAGCTAEGTVYVWDSVTGEAACEPMQNGGRYSSVWFVGEDKEAVVGCPSPVSLVDLKIIVCGDVPSLQQPDRWQRALWKWDLGSRRRVCDPSADVHFQLTPFAALAFGPKLVNMKGPLLCSLSGTGGVCLWDSVTGRRVAPQLESSANGSKLDAHTCVCAVVPQRGLQLEGSSVVLVAAGCRDGSLVLWTLDIHSSSAQSPMRTNPIDWHSGGVTCLSATGMACSDDVLLASGGSDGCIHLFRLELEATGSVLVMEKLCTLWRKGMGSISNMRFGPVNRSVPLLLASGGLDGFVWLWDVTGVGIDSKQPVLWKPVCGHRDSITGLDFGPVSPAGLLLASCSFDGSVLLYMIRPLACRTFGPTFVLGFCAIANSSMSCAVSEAFTADNGDLNCFVAAGAHDGTIAVWTLNLARLEICHSPEFLCGHRRAVTSLRFSDGFLGSSGWDRTVRLWDHVAEPGPSTTPTAVKSDCVEALYPSTASSHRWSMRWMSRGGLMSLDTTGAHIDDLQSLLATKMLRPPVQPDWSTVLELPSGSFRDFQVHLCLPENSSQVEVVKAYRRLRDLTPRMHHGVLVRIEVSLLIVSFALYAQFSSSLCSRSRANKLFWTPLSSTPFGRSGW
jgi:WD40 repeat protein